MSKIRMNTEYRNKLYNRIKDVFEKEDTQERQAFMESREQFNEMQGHAFDVARAVVERSYPSTDVATLRHFKKKYGDPCDVVAKDKCFYFAHRRTLMRTASKQKLNHILILVCSATSMVMSMAIVKIAEHFAHAYYREELKANGLNPDIYAQQEGKDNNPHKTKHVDANNKFLGKGRYDDHNGMTSEYDKNFLLDVIGTSHCRSRAIACTKDEYNIFLAWREAKAKVVSTHQTWISSIMKQADQLKIGLKAYRYLSEGIELATELGIQVDEAELVKSNSTGLTIYNPTNLANLIKGMKNKNVSREDKIKARLQYEKQAIN